ncbi:F-box/kelch-repeat protein At3g06240-like [Impatiens glandulifera]|uniref:F-box/kelch-repeat protein At3g06240-like n=1 Tax=Impatiens glandulifera TaxID=253017 RepID=UPI001FB04CFA|nr:F-box/kelch-repeat protein At3g06240-like [Impatiens glandulifera]
MDAPSDHSLSSIKSSQTLSIPIELVMDILKRLSVRDVLRSRPVCKEWNSLLRTPKFISLHYNRSLQMRHENAASFVYLRTIPSRPPFQSRTRTFDARPRRVSITLTFFTLERTTTKLVAKVVKEEDIMAMLSSLLFPSCSCPTPSDLYYRMVCPFDGMVCFLCAKHIIMYNPATRESQVLLSHPDFYMNRIMGVWFESTMKQQYKVFGLISGDHWYKIIIYDSTLNSWRVTRIMFGIVNSEHGLLLNEVLHFQITDYDDYDDTSETMIVTFDARLETFGHFEFPSSDNICNITLLTFHGNLAFMESNIEMDIWIDSYYDDLWVMTEYGVQHSWTKKTLGPFDFSGYYKNSVYGTPLAFWKNKDEQDELLILAHKHTLSFNLDTMERTDLSLSLVAYGNSTIIPYNVETLLSLK